MVIIQFTLIAYLTFMHWINQTIIQYYMHKHLNRKLIKDNYFIFWFITVLLFSIGLSLDMSLPSQILKTTDFIVIVLLLIPFMMNSNYTPYKSVRGVIAFCLIYPIGEELLFRGLIMDLLNVSIQGHLILIPFPFLKEISLTVLVSAILFSIMHLQYFKFSFKKGVSIKLIYAFIFGIFIGNIVEMTGSLAYGILFHMIANIGATITHFKHKKPIIT